MTAQPLSTVALYDLDGAGQMRCLWRGTARVGRNELASDVPDGRGGWLPIVHLDVDVQSRDDADGHAELSRLLQAGGLRFDRSWIGHGETLVATAEWEIVSGAIRIECTTEVVARMTYPDGRIACSVASASRSDLLVSVALTHPTPPVGDWHAHQRRTASDHQLQHHTHLYARSLIWSGTPEPPLPQGV